MRRILKPAMFFSFLLTVVLISAQTQEKTFPPTGLTDSDVIAFAKNYHQIKSEFDKRGISPEKAVDTPEFLVELEATLENAGISGPNRTLKIAAIVLSFGYLSTKAEFESNPKALAMMRMMKIDPFAEISAITNEADLQVVQRHLLDLALVIKKKK